LKRQEDHNGVCYNRSHPVVKKKSKNCVRKVKISPVTAELKCPHERGETFIESEAVTEVAS
jgi:hypothetical protein